MAFATVNVKTESEDEVQKALKAIPGVIEAHKIYGIYDMIIRIKAETVQELKDIIEKVRRVDKVTSTITMFVI